MLQPAVLLLSCLLLRVASSAPLSSDSGSSSPSDEDLQPPAVFPVVGVASQQTPPTISEAPPGVVVEVEDTKSNITLSFAIFILTEEEEGSGTDGRGRSENNNSSDDISDDLSSEEQDIQPMASLLPTETGTSSQPMKKEYDDHMMNPSSEDMMSDQPAYTGAEYNSWEVKSQPSVTVADYLDYKNITSSDDSDDFNNSTESTEISDQPARTSSDEPTLFLSDDFSNSSSSEVAELKRNLHAVTLNPEDKSASSSRQKMFGTNAVDKPALDPVSQEETSSVHQDRVGSRLQEVFRSIQEVVDLLSGNQEVMGVKLLGSTPNLLSQKGVSLSSDESSEAFGRVGSGPNTQTGVSSDPDSHESLEATGYSIQQGTASRDSTQEDTGPTTSSGSDLISPAPHRKEVQDRSAMSIQAAAGLNPVGPHQDVAPTPPSTLKDTLSPESARVLHQVNVSLHSDSSEESQGSVGTQEVGSMTSSPGLSRLSSPEVSSSSEEEMMAPASSSSPLLVSSPVPSTQTPTRSQSFSSESEESELSDSASPGLDSGNHSQSKDLHRNPDPTCDSNPRLGLNFSSEISECEESPTVEVPTDANSAAIRGAIPTVDYRTNPASMDAKLDSGVKDAEADISVEATTDSSTEFSLDADLTTAAAYSTSLPNMHVSSGVSTDANKGAGNVMSVEEDDDASTEATAASAVSMKPTSTTEYRTNPPDSRASTDAIANVEKEQAGADVSTEAKPNSPGPKQYASSEENMASPLPPPRPPRRKRPYRFGFLGPISHSYGNQPVARETVSMERVASSHTHAREPLAVRQRHDQNVFSDPLHDFFNSQYDADRERRQQMVGRQASRNQMKVSVAAVANPAKSSSEETN